MVFNCLDYVALNRRYVNGCGYCLFLRYCHCICLEGWAIGLDYNLWTSEYKTEVPATWAQSLIMILVHVIISRLIMILVHVIINRQLNSLCKFKTTCYCDF